VKLRYGTAIYRLSLISPNCGYWALSEEVDAVDRQKGGSVAECEAVNLLRAATTYRHDMMSGKRRGAIW
jgi:hypothetical protein